MRTFTAWVLTFAIMLFSTATSYAASSSMSAASNSSGGVTVKVTHRAPQPPNELRFEVALDAHSLDLDPYDLRNLTLLRDANGKTYEPLNFEKKGSGHHREAVVFFPQPSAGGQVEVIIKDVAGVKERVFRFNIG
jgi:hypothetical protein